MPQLFSPCTGACRTNVRIACEAGLGPHSTHACQRSREHPHSPEHCTCTRFQTLQPQKHAKAYDTPAGRLAFGSRFGPSCQHVMHTMLPEFTLTSVWGEKSGDIDFPLWHEESRDSRRPVRRRRVAAGPDATAAAEPAGPSRRRDATRRDTRTAH